MAEVKLSAHVPAPADRSWVLVSDLSRLGEWLSLHEAWRGEVPTELAVGVQITGVVRAKGMRNKVTWEVTELDPPHRIALVGTGVGGTKVTLAMDVRSSKAGSDVDFRAEFSHPALRGPLGSVAARTVKGDLEASLRRFTALV